MKLKRTNKTVFMHNNKLLKLMAQLPKKDIKDFSKYINALHSKESNLPRLLTYLRKYHPEFESFRLGEKHIYFEIFGDKKVGKKALPNLFSKLNLELKRFLWWNNYEDFPVESSLLLLRIFKKYGINNHVRSQLKELSGILEKSKIRDQDYWLDRMRLADEHYYYLGTEKTGNTQVLLKEAIIHLDNFHEAAKLRYASELENRENVVEEDEYIVKFLDHLENTVYVNSSAYHNCFQLNLRLLKYRDNKDYFLLKNAFISAIDSFGLVDQQILISYLLNHCIRCNRRGDKAFIPELLELFKFGVSKNLFISGGYFIEGHFLNILDLGCHLKDFDWIADFINETGKILDPRIKSAYINYSKAFLAFSQRNFEECYKKLKIIETIDPFFVIRLRWLDLVSRVETRRSDIENACDYIRKYVKSTKDFKDSYKRSVLLSVKMIEKMEDPNCNKDKLKKEFYAASDYYYKEWVEKKLNE